eukprot:gene20837-biopygen6975
MHRVGGSGENPDARERPLRPGMGAIFPTKVEHRAVAHFQGFMCRLNQVLCMVEELSFICVYVLYVYNIAIWYGVIKTPHTTPRGLAHTGYASLIAALHARCHGARRKVFCAIAGTIVRVGPIHLTYFFTHLILTPEQTAFFDNPSE